jgi:hypothetical protein
VDVVAVARESPAVEWAREAAVFTDVTERELRSAVWAAIDERVRLSGSVSEEGDALARQVDAERRIDAEPFRVDGGCPDARKTFEHAAFRQLSDSRVAGGETANDRNERPVAAIEG